MSIKRNVRFGPNIFKTVNGVQKIQKGEKTKTTFTIQFEEEIIQLYDAKDIIVNMI